MGQEACNFNLFIDIWVDEHVNPFCDTSFWEDIVSDRTNLWLIVTKNTLVKKEGTYIFLSFALPVSINQAINLEMVDLLGTREFGTAIWKSLWTFHHDFKMILTQNNILYNSLQWTH